MFSGKETEVVCPGLFGSGILLTVICATPAFAICEAVKRMRVMIEASQVTTGVTPDALGVQ